MENASSATPVDCIVMRLDAANEFIESIASHGRRFFEYVHDDGRQVAHFRRGDWGHNDKPPSWFEQTAERSR
jgi:hypothetical protein